MSTPWRRTAAATLAAMSGSSVRMGCSPPSSSTTLEAPRCEERLGHLQADVAATDDDDVATPTGRNAVQQACAVLERLHAPHPVRVDAGDRRADRMCPGGDVQQVEPDLDRALVGQIAHVESPAIEIDGHDLVQCPDIDAVLVAELLRGAHDEVVDVADRRR